jgi:hypothetical protein
MRLVANQIAPAMTMANNAKQAKTLCRIFTLLTNFIAGPRKLRYRRSGSSGGGGFHFVTFGEKPIETDERNHRGIDRH